MTDHPLHSDKDSYIKNLENEVKKLKSGNEKLENSLRNKRRRKLKTVLKVLLILTFVVPLITGVSYLGYRCQLKKDYFNNRCSKLCKVIIGDFSLYGYRETNGGFCSIEKYCLCKTRIGAKISLPVMTNEEIEGNLFSISKKLDIASWKYCMDVKDKASKRYFANLDCSHIPWIVNLHGQPEQDRVDGGND